MASLYSISSVARDEGISEEGRVTDEQTSKTPAFTPHALRGRVLAEVHARPSLDQATLAGHVALDRTTASGVVLSLIHI